MGRRTELDPWIGTLQPSVPLRVTAWEDGPYSLAAQLRWPLGLSRAAAGSDVIFFPHYDAPTLGRIPPYVVTVHDVTQFVVPGGFPAVKRAAGRRLLGRVTRHAERVLTVSSTTREDLARLRVVRGDQVTVIPNGVGSDFRPLDADEERAAREKWRGALPYLLLVGWDRPHKNALFALDVLAGLRERGHELRLMLAGPGGRMEALVTDRARALGLTEGVGRVGRVEPGVLRELYALATAVLVPSLYEGFGLPVLEGLACGTPVLASDRGALPGIAGPARVLPVTGPAPWIAAVEEVLEEAGSPDRRVARIAHARRHDWAEASRAVLAVLREVHEGADGVRARARTRRSEGSG